LADCGISIRQQWWRLTWPTPPITRRPVMRIAQTFGFQSRRAGQSAKTAASRSSDRATVAGPAGFHDTHFFTLERKKNGSAFLEQELGQFPPDGPPDFSCWRGSRRGPSAHYGSSRTLDAPRHRGLGLRSIVSMTAQCLGLASPCNLLAREVGLLATDAPRGRFLPAPVCTFV